MPVGVQERKAPEYELMSAVKAFRLSASERVVASQARVERIRALWVIRDGFAVGGTVWPECRCPAGGLGVNNAFVGQSRIVDRAPHAGHLHNDLGD